MKDYFLKRSLFIFLWFACLAGLLRIEVSWLTETMATIILFTFIILGSIILGYRNTYFAPESKIKMSLILHTRFIGLMLILDLLFGKSVWYFDLARNFGFLGLFLLGTFIFYKKNFNLNVAKIPPFQ
ncbi:TPA: hypothetical protein ACGCCX_000425 [Acinetobacter nosocomialis]|uniref:ATP synthase subunit I n=1 Tax=Acinetobacter nosocomialis NIPH 386 TaxID=1217985 RepID=A0AAV3ISU3_ACINO|nr:MULTISPECIES: hypothetical protein [Acinetobacter]ENV42601.1 hypothetical protein F958_00333 [Acinetobacter nosocomialis NIPH 386]KQD12108.1 hypothetical protein APD05_04480 [Acinetobacter nosocomialis]MBP1504350.1 hypothetical protein [Acinetobacter nosocomialis]MBR7696280.1 hypothetical protein [Acinetobacter nosocomialis]MBR7712214.1 hypothetical protein [Acinetobacter nosocomialis]